METSALSLLNQLSSSFACRFLLTYPQESIGNLSISRVWGLLVHLTEGMEKQLIHILSVGLLITSDTSLSCSMTVKSLTHEGNYRQ